LHAVWEFLNYYIFTLSLREKETKQKQI